MTIRTKSILFSCSLAVLVAFGCSRNSQDEVRLSAEQDDHTIAKPDSRDDKKKTEKAVVKETKKPAKAKVVEIKDNTIKTAEQYLYAFDHNTGMFGLHKFELPEAEIDKVVKELRGRYGFESLRDRLSYEDQGNRKPNPNADSEQLFSHLGFRRKSLMKLHSEEVRAFVSRPMNGFSRVIRPSPEMLRFPTPPPKTPDRFTFYPGAKERQEKVTDHLHKAFVFGFAGHVGGTTFVKSIDEVAGFKPHSININMEAMDSPKTIPFHYPDKEYLEAIRSESDKGDVAWKLNQFQLVSLLKHKEPRVYVSENLPGMEELSDDEIETRELNEFEKFALKRILDGEEVVIKEHETRINMMGSIRAEKQCLECHSVNEKSLLGTFSYEFRVIKGLEKELQKDKKDQIGT